MYLALSSLGGQPQQNTPVDLKLRVSSISSQHQPFLGRLWTLCTVSQCRWYSVDPDITGSDRVLNITLIYKWLCLAVGNCKPGSTAGVLQLGYICAQYTHADICIHTYTIPPLQRMCTLEDRSCNVHSHIGKGTLPFTTFQIQVEKVMLALYKQSLWTCVLVIPVAVIKHHD